MKNTINGIAVLLFAALFAWIAFDIIHSAHAHANVWVPPVEIAQPDLGTPEYNTPDPVHVDVPAPVSAPAFSAPDTSALQSGLDALAPSVASSTMASTTEAQIISLMQEVIRILLLLIQATAAQHAV